MCGHVGVAGHLESKDEKLLKKLLIQDYFRGPDSTGFASMSTGGNIKIAKINSHPIDLFQMKPFIDALNGYQSIAFMGHNRYATKGAVTTFNAHPYAFDDIVGCHNGTLDKSSWDALEKNLGENFPVDSMALIAHIARFGIEATAPLLSGAWAIVWMDKTDKSLNFLRNDQRPFWMAYDEEVKKIFWASESIMIRAATSLVDQYQQSYKLWTTKDGAGYFSTEIDALYRVDLVDLNNGKIGKDKQPDFRVRDKKGKVVHLKGKEVPKVVTTTYTGGYNYTKADPFTGTNGTNSPSTNPKGFSPTSTALGPKDSSTTQSPASDKIIHLRGSEFNPLAGYLSEADFTAFAKYGCSWCQCDVEYGDVGITVYPDLLAVRCADCSGTKTHNRIFLTPAEYAKVAQ